MSLFVLQDRFQSVRSNQLVWERKRRNKNEKQKDRKEDAHAHLDTLRHKTRESEKNAFSNDNLEASIRGE